MICIKTDIAISDGVIVGLGNFSCENEIVNVSGYRGIQFMLDRTENVNCDVYYMLSFCVTATKFESNFSDFTVEEMKDFKNHKRVLGLGEIMDYESIVNCDESMYAKLEFFKDKVIDAHAPFLSFDDLQIYRIAGALTDHETTAFEDALNKIRLGFYVLIRDGSAAHNLDDVLSKLIEKNIPLNRCCFCTDDKHVDDMLQNGHMTTHIKKAVQLGLSAIDAIKLCTINPANCYGLKNIGALSVGYKANIVILDD